MRVRCFSRNAPRMPGTEFSAKEVATSTGHGSNQRPSASRERILQLCDRSVPLLESRRTEGERRYTEEERIGRGKYRHLVNTCTSRAGPSRVREGCLSSSSSSMFFFLSFSLSPSRSSTLTVTWPCIARGLFLPFHFLRLPPLGKLTSSRCRFYIPFHRF